MSERIVQSTTLQCCAVLWDHFEMETNECYKYTTLWAKGIGKII